MATQQTTRRRGALPTATPQVRILDASGRPADGMRTDLDPSMFDTTDPADPQLAPAFARRFKVSPVRFPADECPYVKGRVIEGEKVVDPGTTLYPHKREFVWAIPVGDLRAWFALNRMRTDEDEEASAEDKLRRMETSFDEIGQRLSRRVVAWTLTGWTGVPLPQPLDNPAAFEEMSADELLWLLSTISDEAPADRKNGSRPSRGT